MSIKRKIYRFLRIIEDGKCDECYKELPENISSPDKDNTCDICKRLSIVHCHRCNVIRDEKQGYYYYPRNNTWIYLCNLCNGKYSSDVTDYRDQWYKDNKYKP